MKPYRLNQLELNTALQKKAREMNQDKMHLKHLVSAPNRLSNYSAKGGGLFLDYSRQRLDDQTMQLLIDAADKLNLTAKFQQMSQGALINKTENRAVLHTATRSFSSTPIYVDGHDIMPDMQNVRNAVKTFCNRVHNGEIKGCTGKAFRHAVVVGIGGSYLGAEFISTALAAYANKAIRIHYLANVDIHNFGAVADAIDPETTLWIIISKSYTTAETTANKNQAIELMKDKGLEPSKHIVTVTSKGSPGDDPGDPVLATFYMYDFIGGRYSVTSAVGAAPLSIYLGNETFERFLKGAEQMDLHAAQAPAHANLPLIAALISVWNTDYLGYRHNAIIPYCSALQKLAPHIQQLNMESNGKGADIQGQMLDTPAGTVIFGEPGANAQHSFFQLAHQGQAFPIDFIGVLNPQYTQYQSCSKGVTNHQELWANMIAQAKVLAIGKDSEDKTRYFSGNRPSSTLVLDDLSPENVGRLLSFYEARTVFEGFAWGVNSFDQFGVELGKIAAADLRRQMADKNQDPDHYFEASDPIAKMYLEMLFEGKI
ncbi:MAG: glucose-6-phosphate isomerase [Desulfobacteraceae bacterium]|nr:glucose-6-phosphate isomerase [Desulfobacteraceae bacterium]